MEKKPYGILMFLTHTIASFHAQLDLFPLLFFLASHFSLFDASYNKDDFLKQKHDQQSNAAHNAPSCLYYALQIFFPFLLYQTKISW